MDAVAAVLGDTSLLCALAQLMLRIQAARSLAVASCACRRLRFAAEAGARSLVLRFFPEATAACGPQEPWSAHAALLCALIFGGRAGEERGEQSLDPLRYALYGGDVATSAPWAVSGERVVQAERLVKALLERRGEARLLLGPRGPFALVPLQRRLLRRLCLHQGAMKRAADLARLASEKTQGTCWELEVALDLAEVLNLCAYARTYVSDSPPHLAEFEEAVRAADLASPLSRLAAASLRSRVPSTPRARRLLGRTMASAAHAWLLDTLQLEVEQRLVWRWGDGEAMFREALVVHDRAVDLAVRRVEHAALRLRGASPDARSSACELSWHRPALQDHEAILRGQFPPPPELGGLLLKEALALARTGCAELRGPVLELGECVAGLAECWFCIAAVARHLDAELLGIGAEPAANKALEIFEDALDLFAGETPGGQGTLERSVEYADTLKDYGKVIACFFDANDTHAIKSPLPKALRLHEELLGAAHPRTRNVRRLCAHE